jgi:transcriptional regulator with XRE-family HTH domain
MAKARSKKSAAMKLLEELTGGRATFAETIRTIRECEEQTLEAFAKRLGVSRAYLCDVEKSRRGVSAERAAKWASKLGYPEWQFVQLALQDQLDAAGLKYKVGVRAA